MKLAFYKGPGNWLDKLIRIATWSRFSHCELVVSEFSMSSSPRDGGVRIKQIDFDPTHWEFISIPGSSKIAVDWFLKHDQAPYDYLGAFKTILPFMPNSERKWFCSEAIATALVLPNARKFTPKKLYEYYTQ